MSAPVINAPLAAGCVVSSGRPVPIAGTAAASAPVRVSLAGWQIDTVAGPDGRWQVIFDPMPAGGPYELVAEAGGERTALPDIMVGELWLAVGPSAPAAADSADPLLRSRPADGGAWRAGLPLPGTVLATARAARSEQPGVAIGIIALPFDGADPAVWLRPDMQLAAPSPDQARRSLAAWRDAVARWRQRVDERDPGASNWWADWSTDDATWPTCRLPMPHAETKLAKLVGSVWYRRRVRIPESWRNRAIALDLAAVDLIEEVYVNGVRIGEGDPRLPGASRHRRRYAPIPATRLRPAEENLVAVRVLDTGGSPGGIWAPDSSYRLAIAPVDAAPGEELELADGWRWRVGYDGAGDRLLPIIPAQPPDPDGPDWPGGQWQALVAPLLPVAPARVLWCADSDPTAVAENWQSAFGLADLPFVRPSRVRS